MNTRLISSVRRPMRWALLPAVAMIGILAGLPTAFAFDQQATDDAMSNAISQQAARGGNYAGSYAQSTHEGTVYAPRHRSYR
jgi:hypothetical protein